MTETETETITETLNRAAVDQHARYNGLYLVSTTRAELQDKFWLSSSTNWVTTEPGKPLADIDAVLDDIDGGEWARLQAEAAERREQLAAEQEEQRLRLVTDHESDDDEGQDDDAEAS